MSCSSWRSRFATVGQVHLLDAFLPLRAKQIPPRAERPMLQISRISETMNPEIDIDAALIRLKFESSDNELGNKTTSPSEPTPHADALNGVGNGLTRRQPIADPMDRPRRRPVPLSPTEAIELQNDGAVPGNVDTGKVQQQQQQRLRKLRELPPDAAATLYIQLASSSPAGLRQSPGLMDHLVGLMHLRNRNGADHATARANAASAMTIVVEETTANSTEKKIWELLRLVWYHCEVLRSHLQGEETITTSQHAATISTMTELMTTSFEADTKVFLRLVGTQLCMTSLLALDHACYPQLRPTAGSDNPAEGHHAFSLRNSVRVNACTILCNLLVNNPAAKTELAQTQGFLANIKKQLVSPLEELVRVSAVLLQNLSFRVDNVVKSELSDANVIPLIVQAASVAQMRPTVVALTSALWNMSAHSSETYESNNKATLCSSLGGLQLIVNLLDIRGDDTHSQKILENTAGILQNISSHIVRNTPLLISMRRLNIYAAVSLCLRRRNTGSMLRSVVAALSNFAAGMAEDKEAIRMAGIIPQLEEIEARSSQYKDPKIGVYAKQALTNLNLPPVADQPRRQSYPLQHTRSGSYSERRASPLTSDSPAETSFRPSPTSSNGELNESAVMDPSSLHRSVPGRMHQRRQQRLEQSQQLYISRENIVVNGSRDNLRVSSENVRSTISADNLRSANGYARSEGGSGEVPQKPPRKRSTDLTAAGPLPAGASPFFTSQTPQALAQVTISTQASSRSGRPGESWHARSQSDSAASMAHIPSNRLRSHGARRQQDTADGEHGKAGHSRQYSNGSANSAGRHHLLSPSPITPSSSQEIMLSQPILVGDDLSPSQSILGRVEEVTVSITNL